MEKKAGGGPSERVAEPPGAEFAELAAENARKLGIDGGVKVTRLFAALRSQTDIREGSSLRSRTTRLFDPRELETALSGKKGGVMLEGIYEDVPGVYYYAFGMDS